MQCLLGWFSSPNRQYTRYITIYLYIALHTNEHMITYINNAICIYACMHAYVYSFKCTCRWLLCNLEQNWTNHAKTLADYNISGCIGWWYEVRNGSDTKHLHFTVRIYPHSVYSWAVHHSSPWFPRFVLFPCSNLRNMTVHYLCVLGCHIPWFGGCWSVWAYCKESYSFGTASSFGWQGRCKL